MSTTATVPREVLRDRWDAAMKWERNGGGPSEAYGALADALASVVGSVTGRDPWDDVDGEIVLSEDLLDAIGDLVISRVEHLGLAR